MTNDRAYLRLFRREPEDLTRREIRVLLDAELVRDDPDTELIEYCMDALCEPAPGAKAAPAGLRRGVKPALALAAAILILLSCVTAAAAVLYPELFSSLARLYADRFRIGHTEEATAEAYLLADTALGRELAAHGISPVLLPEALTDGTYTVDAVEYETTGLIRSAHIRFSQGAARGSVTIAVYAPGAALPVTDYGAARDAEYLDTGRIVCWIFTQGGHTVIDFADGRTVYTVLLEQDREAAVWFAKCIK